MAQSLDGFVARADHRLDWLTSIPTHGDDHGYAAFTATIDGIVMGRGSYNNVLSFGEWPYTKPVIVMSKSLTQHDVPEAIAGKVRVTDLEPAPLMKMLGEEGWSRAYIDGGLVVQSFIREGLVQDMVLTVAPVMIGEGKRMFGPWGCDVGLELVSSTTFKSGMVQLKYRLPASNPEPGA